MNTETKSVSIHEEGEAVDGGRDIETTAEKAYGSETWRVRYQETKFCLQRSGALLKMVSLVFVVFWGLLWFFFLPGHTLPKEYVCGSVPPPAEAYDDLPTCVRAQASDLFGSRWYSAPPTGRPLCRLFDTSTDPTDPPEWCNAIGRQPSTSCGGPLVKSAEQRGECSPVAKTMKVFTSYLPQNRTLHRFLRVRPMQSGKYGMEQVGKLRNLLSFLLVKTTLLCPPSASKDHFVNILSLSCGSFLGSQLFRTVSGSHFDSASLAQKKERTLISVESVLVRTMVLKRWCFNSTAGAPYRPVHRPQQWS